MTFQSEFLAALNTMSMAMFAVSFYQFTVDTILIVNRLQAKQSRYPCSDYNLISSGGTNGLLDRHMMRSMQMLLYRQMYSHS